MTLSVVTLFCVCALTLASAQQTLDRYPIDWTQVPVTPPDAKNLTSSCICDLTANSCDTGCCCDPYCPEGLTEYSEETGTCLPQGPATDTLKYCVPKNYFARVNLPSNGDFYYVTKEQTDLSFYSQLTCIVSDSNPDLGKSYPDPPAGNVDDNANLAQCPAVQSPPQFISNYNYKSFVNILRGTVPTRLNVPYPAFSSECNDDVGLGYLLPIPSGQQEVYQQCQRTLANYNLTTACNGQGVLSPTHFSGVRFYTGKTLVTTPQPINVVDMLFLDPATGALAAVNPNTTITAYSATTGTCQNALAYLNITIFYTLQDAFSITTPGYIEEIQMSFIVTNFNDTATAVSNGVKVTWVELSVTTPVMVQQFSGNPGYLPGFPVLAGSLASIVNGTDTKQAISRIIGGLPVGAPSADGSCDPSALAAVKYGYNTSSTCSISLTTATLQSFCSGEANNPAKYVAFVLDGMYQQILNNSLYVGIWGNSDYDNIKQWLQVQVSGYPFSPLIYSPSDNACTGVIVGYDLQLLTGVAFSSNNLQKKVLFANLCFKTGVWDFSEDQGLTQAQRFYLNFNVSFIPLAQQGVKVKKPTPPLATPLPKDIFYPFVTQSGSTMAAGSLTLLIAAAVGLMLVL